MTHISIIIHCELHALFSSYDLVGIQYRLSLIWPPVGQCSLAGIYSEVVAFQKV